jgi:hypothetical protein
MPAQGWAEEFAWFRWTVNGSTSRWQGSPGADRGSRSGKTPVEHARPWAAKNFIRRLLADLVRLRLAESRA